eukprot:1292268-Prymnesium_polylepis.2
MRPATAAHAEEKRKGCRCRPGLEVMLYAECDGGGHSHRARTIALGTSRTGLRSRGHRDGQPDVLVIQHHVASEASEDLHGMHEDADAVGASATAGCGAAQPGERGAVDTALTRCSGLPRSGTRPPPQHDHAFSLRERLV